MADERRIFKEKMVSGVDPEKTFIKVDSVNFKRPGAMSAATLGKILNLELNADLDSKNVSALDFNGQDVDPVKPP